MPDITIRDILPAECPALGALLVAVYSRLEGFPSPEQQPAYYQLLADVGSFASKPQTRVLVAVEADGTLLGGVVYFGDMREYGSGGSATQQSDAAGIRLLAVAPQHRGSGVGRKLTEHCIALARAAGCTQVILHTTQAMLPAWRLYEQLGFTRSPDLDFQQQTLPVFGFRLPLS